MDSIVVLSNVTRGLLLFRRELLETLVKEYSVIVYACDSGNVDDLERIGCKVILIKKSLHSTNPINDIALFKYYESELSRIRPVVVLTYTIKPNIYGGMVCSKLGIPYIANVTGLGTAVENSGFLQWLLVNLLKRGLKKASRVFFQNVENRDFFLQHKIIMDRYDLLPGSGVNLDRFKVLDYPHDDLINFVFISRIIKEKGIDQYLDAAQVVRRDYPQTRFHVCGDADDYYKGILEEMNDRGIIIYHGKVDDVIEIHRMSSCTIHPTYYPEGMSNVLLESCACGRPIITTNRAGCREIVEEGINGFIVNQKDSQDLIDKINMFLSLTWEERRDMGIAGREKVEKEFDRKIVIDKYMSAIKTNSKNNS